MEKKQYMVTYNRYDTEGDLADVFKFLPSFEEARQFADQLQWESDAGYEYTNKPCIYEITEIK